MATSGFRFRDYDQVIDLTGVLVDLVRRNQRIQLIRSGYTRDDMHRFLSAIRLGCSSAEPGKVIRFILPSLNNFEMLQREQDLGNTDHRGLSISVLRDRLGDWYKAIDDLRSKLSPAHNLELRVTGRPYRYHGFQGDDCLLYGQAWHFKASIDYTIFVSRSSNIFHYFSEDFETHWDETSPISAQSREGGRLQAVLFSDIMGFTELTPKLSRDQLIRLIQLHRRIINDSIQPFHGYIVNRIGDALLVKFNDATRAINAGILIQKNLEVHNSKTNNDKEKFRVRIGVSTGTIAQMIDEGDSLLTSDIFGNAVNLASRVQQDAEAGEVYMCEMTRSLIPEAEIKCEKVGEKSFKGMAKPITVWRAAI